MLRFSLLASLLSACAAMSYAASLPQVKEYFPVEAVRLSDSPFKNAQDRDVDYILALDPDRLLAPFLKEAGLTPKADNYPNWENTGLDGHIGGHYLSALSYMWAATGNPAIGARLQYVLAELKRCQDASGNGYVAGVPGGRQVWDEIAAGKIDANAFGLNNRWVPLYNIHKTFAGLRDATLQAHSKEALEMLVKLTDWFQSVVGNLTDDQIQTMLRSEHGGLNEVFADVYAITSEPRYLDLARRFSHRAILDPLVDGRNELTGKHANTQIPKVIGYQRIAALEGNPEWSRASRFFWDEVVAHRSVSIGGNSVREHFHSPDDFSSMLDSEQGPETCNTYNMLRLTKMLSENSNDTLLADYIERALYNHILSTQHPTRGGFVYFTPMRPGHYRVYSQPQTSFWCCVGSGLENHARYGEYIYAHDDKEDLFVNLFIPSTLDWNGNHLSLATQLPASNRVTITLDRVKHSPRAINIRVPGWTSPSDITVTVNGMLSKNAIITDGYLRLDRRWRSGDKIEVTLPMALHTEQLADGTPNYSILYGPVVLAADLGDDNLTGLWADDSRGGHIANGPKMPLDQMPVIVGAPDSIVHYIKRLDGDGLRFTMSHVAPGGNLELRPFASLHECRYMVYWPVIDAASMAERNRQAASRQARDEALDRATLDRVICGEQQPESDHFITMTATEAGSDGDLHWRRALPGGNFTYTLTPRERSANTLRVYYKSSPDATAQVFLNDRPAGLLTAQADGPMRYIDFPINFVDTPRYTVTIATPDDGVSPRVYEIRLLSL